MVASGQNLPKPECSNSAVVTGSKSKHVKRDDGQRTDCRRGLIWTVLILCILYIVVNGWELVSAGAFFL